MRARNRQFYAAGRSELARELSGLLSNEPHGVTILRELLWTSAYTVDDAGAPGFVLPPPRGRFLTQDFGPLTGGVERAPPAYLRLRTTTNWLIPLVDYHGLDDYLARLSKSTRKKARWLLNVYRRGEAVIRDMKTAADLEVFLSIFRTQWPDSDWEGRYKPAFLKIFCRLFETGRGKGYLVETPDGEPAAAGLGYFTDRAFNLSMLTRRAGALDTFSPGFYLTLLLITTFLDEGRPDALFLGPGEFDYKRTFLAEGLPIYRYECFSWRNVFGIVRLYNRSRKQARHPRR